MTVTTSNDRSQAEQIEFQIRGRLAAALKCWGRLTGEESDELVALFAAGNGRQPAMNTYDPNIQWGRHRVEITYQQWDYTLQVFVNSLGNCKGYSVLDTAIFTHSNELSERQGDHVVLILVKKDQAGVVTDMLEASCNADDEDLEAWLMDMCVGVRIVEYVEEKKADRLVRANQEGGAQ